MALLQIDTEARIAELYNGEDGWRVTYTPTTTGGSYQVVGPAVLKDYPAIGDLLAAPELPNLVKWAARGLPGIPLEVNDGASPQ